jgi:glycosyltransferase involved in cell wall biosynthesis
LAADLAQALDHALGATTVVLAHNVTTLHKNLALTAALHQLARAQRVRVLAWCHDFAWEDPVYAHELRPGYPWDLLRTPWPQARYVVVSDARRGDLARLLGLDPQAIVVIPPGIDAAEFFQVSPMTTQWLDELHLLDAAPLLLLPARITRRKNIELAIDVVAALHTRGWNATLLVMGPLGPHNPSNQEYLELLQARAARVRPTPQDPDTAPAVIFLQAYGPVGDAERRDLYALSDALFFPSAREGFGIPILEAGLARLPIFCADISPFHESAHADAHYFGLNDPPTQIAARLADFFAADARYQLKRRIVTEYAWSALYRSRLAPLLELMV